MTKHASATAVLRRKGWYRQLQYLLLGEMSDQPEAPRMLDAMALRGFDPKEGKASLGRWCKGECKPDAKYVSLRARQLASAKLTAWWDQVAPNLKAVQDDQIRLLGFIDQWTSQEVDEICLLELLRAIMLRWEPKKDGLCSPTESPDYKRWLIDSLKEDHPSGRIQFELACRADFTSMAVFLMSLGNLNWPSQSRTLRSDPFSYNTPFSAWCVDTVGCCMLVDRLYQRWGDSAYSRATPGIDVASRVRDLIFFGGESRVLMPPGAPHQLENRKRQLRDIFVHSGVPVHNALHFYQVFTDFVTLIERMLWECSSSTQEVGRLRSFHINSHPSFPG